LFIGTGNNMNPSIWMGAEYQSKRLWGRLKDTDKGRVPPCLAVCFQENPPEILVFKPGTGEGFHLGKPQKGKGGGGRGCRRNRFQTPTRERGEVTRGIYGAEEKTETQREGRLKSNAGKRGKPFFRKESNTRGHQGKQGFQLTSPKLVQSRAHIHMRGGSQN